MNEQQMNSQAGLGPIQKSGESTATSTAFFGGEPTNANPCGNSAPRPSARFLWVDEESGDELTVEVRGDEAFFSELESIGFERQDGEAAQRKDVPDSAEGQRASVDSSTKTSRGLNASVDVGIGKRVEADASWKERRGA